jgi:hypothetical protein
MMAPLADVADDRRRHTVYAICLLLIPGTHRRPGEPRVAQSWSANVLATPHLRVQALKLGQFTKAGRAWLTEARAVQLVEGREDVARRGWVVVSVLGLAYGTKKFRPRASADIHAPAHWSLAGLHLPKTWKGGQEGLTDAVVADLHHRAASVRSGAAKTPARADRKNRRSAGRARHRVRQPKRGVPVRPGRSRKKRKAARRKAGR